MPWLSSSPAATSTPPRKLEAEPEARSRIQAIADEIKAQKATNVRVFGFTDNLARTPTA